MREFLARVFQEKPATEQINGGKAIEEEDCREEQQDTAIVEEEHMPIRNQKLTIPQEQKAQGHAD